MHEYRRGKAWCITDNGAEHYLELVPVRPKGWMIRKNQAPIYGGQVFMYGHAMMLIERIEALLHLRAQSGKDCRFEHMEGLYIELQDAPKDAIFRDDIDGGPNMFSLLPIDTLDEISKASQDSLDSRASPVPHRLPAVTATPDRTVPAVLAKKVSIGGSNGNQAV